VKIVRLFVEKALCGWFAAIPDTNNARADLYRRAGKEKELICPV
jgi:hypothetical protein